MAEKTQPFVYDTSPSQACCAAIEVTLDGDVIENVKIVKGCDGNHRGLSALVKGRNAAEVIGLLRDTPCGDKDTSCPDQLARALEQALTEA